MSTYGSCYGARSGAFPQTRCSECRKQEPWTVAFFVLVFCSSYLLFGIFQLFALLTLFKMGRNSVDDAVKAVVIHLWNFMSRPSTQLKSNLFSLRNVNSKRHAIFVLTGIPEKTIRNILDEAGKENQSLSQCNQEPAVMEVVEEPASSLPSTPIARENRLLIKPIDYGM